MKMNNLGFLVSSFRSFENSFKVFLKIRRPPLGGIKAAGLELLVCYFLCLQTAQIPWDLRHQIHFSESVFSQKNTSFETCLQGLKNQRNGSQGIKKHYKSIPKFFKNDFHEKSNFATLSSENNDLEVPNVDKSSQKSITNGLETSLTIKHFLMHFETQQPL